MASKRGQLVCQHLEKLSRDALEEYQGIIKDYVRGRHGIYALYQKNKLYYIGLASDLRNRLKQHLKDRHGQSWDRFSIYLTLDESHLKELETLFLKITKPKGNSQTGKFAKSEDMKNRFRKDIRAHHRKIEQKMLGTPKAASTRKEMPVAGKSNGRTPVLAAHAGRVKELRAKFKGALLKARVNKDGTIRFNGKLYNSPSLAGAAAVNRPTCNGWTFWEYERAPGEWVLLDNLRR